MTGAIEFLRKAKAICEDNSDCVICPIADFCLTDMDNITDEADLVRKVMDYRLEDKDAKRN